MRFIGCLTMTYRDTVWNTSVPGFWHSNFYYILSQRCGSKKSRNVHSINTCSYVQKVNNAVTVFPCWGAVSHRSFSLEDLLSSLFPKLNIPGSTTFLKIHFSLLSNWTAVPSQESQFLPIQGFWGCHEKKKLFIQKNYIPSLPAWCQLCPSYAFQKNQVTLLLAL